MIGFWRTMNAVLHKTGLLRRRAPLWVGVAFVVATTACSAGSPPQVVVAIALGDGVPRPAYVTVEWGTATAGTENHRLPREGQLPAEGSPLATVQFDLSSRETAERKMIVRGFDGSARRVGIAARRVPFTRGRQTIDVTLAATLPDGDGDGVPDAVDDDCPATPCRSTDAGAPDAAVDASDPLAPDGGGPDTLPAAWTVRPELAQGLVGYWKLDDGPGSAMAHDSSGQGNHGTVMGAPAAADWTAGVTGGALDFMSKHAIRVAPSASLDRITNRLTIAAWVWSRNPRSPTAVLSRHAGASKLELYYLQVSHAYAQLILDTASMSGVLVMHGRRIPTETWLHLAATWDGTTARLFVNGTPVDSETYTKTLAPVTSPLFIGANVNNAEDRPEEMFAGQLDEVVLYDRALSATEIGWLATGSLPPAQ